jgi:hypothetical protein
VGELEAAIAALLDDPERRARMGANGRTRVEELFSWRAVATTVAEVYEETIAAYRAEQGDPRHATDPSVSSDPSDPIDPIDAEKEPTRADR